MTITVYGLPAPQGSKRFVGVKGGRGVMVESSAKVKPWRESVKWAVHEQTSVSNTLSGCLVSGAVTVEMVFTMPKPKSAPKNRRTYPDRKPDLSKLVRSTEDALTDAGVWEDDARVIKTLSSKVFPGEGLDALPVPGAIIRINSVIA